MPAASRASNSRLDAVTTRLLPRFASIHDCVFALDSERRCVFAADELGLFSEAPSCEEPISIATLLAQTHPDALELLRETLQESAATSGALNGRTALSSEFRGHRIELRTLFFDAIITGGDPIQLHLLDSVSGAGVDARNTSDSSQAAPIAELTRKNEELETFVRSVSHDLRSPLVSVLGFARLLRDEFGEPIGRTGLHFVNRIEQAGRNMERLLSDLLELSRIEDTPNCAVHVNPLAVLDQLSAELKLTLDQAGVTLAVPNEAPILVCDRTRLYQLFSNLIGNAIHHADSGGRIEVLFETVEDGWRIVVADDGPGIAVEDRDRIFEAFQTATPPASASRSPHKKKKISGLGLAIVRKIVEAHQGRIHVESELGQGARFVVWLPRETEKTRAP